MNGTSSHHDIQTEPPPSEPLSLESLDARLDTLEGLVGTIDKRSQVIERAVTGVLNSPKFKALGMALWLALTAYLASKGIRVGQ